MMRELVTSRHGALVALAVCACLTLGCSQMPKVRIDPSGERCFIIEEEAPYAYTQPPPGMAPAELPPPPDATATTPAQTLPEPPEEESSCWESLKETFSCREKVVKRVTLSPRRTIAPVGSEVVLLAGVAGSDGFLYTNQRIDWLLSPEGAGEFVQFDGGSWCDPLVCDFTRARKIDNSYLVATTSRSKRRITRGTSNTDDDVDVLKGQTWASVTSATEGTSWVTALGPNLESWENRQQTSVIYWVDAQWVLPCPKIMNAGGRSTLCTCIARQTDNAPQAGWLVRYEITGGPEAAFAPGGSRVVEVPTDATGKACVELYQPTPAPGTNQISVQIVRPAGLGDPNKRLVLGSGCVVQTWSAASLSVRTVGDDRINPGQSTPYQIQVRNSGDMPATNVMVQHDIPAGMVVESSNPPGQATQSAVRWSLGTLAGGETKNIDLNLRSVQGQSYSVCADVTAAGGIAARHCLPVKVNVPQIEIQLSGPEEAKVGDLVQFQMQVVNRGQSPVSGLTITDTFDAGLLFRNPETNTETSTPIRRKITETIPAGAGSQTFGIEFRLAKPGDLCHTVEVTGPGGLSVSKRQCIKATQSPLPPSTLPPSSSGTPPAVPGSPPPLEVSISADKAKQVGETAEFVIQLKNHSMAALNDVRVICTLDPAFDQVTDGTNQTYPMAQQGQVVKNFGTVDSWQEPKVVIRARCKQTSPSACVGVVVATQQGQTEEKTACVEINGGSDPSAQKRALKVTIASLASPIELGKEVTCVIDVANERTRPDSNVLLVVSLPPGLVLEPLRTTLPEGMNYRTERVLGGSGGQVLQFDPVATIPANGRLETIRLRLKANQPGDQVVGVELRSDNQDPPVLDNVKIQVNALPLERPTVFPLPPPRQKRPDAAIRHPTT